MMAGAIGQTRMTILLTAPTHPINANSKQLRCGRVCLRASVKDDMNEQLKLPRAVLSEINKLAHQAAQEAEVQIRERMVQAALKAIADGVDWRMEVDRVRGRVT